MATGTPALSSATPLDGAQDAVAVPRAPALSADELARLVDEFEVEHTVEQIEAGDFKRVALQIPDELLHSAVPLFRALRQRLPLSRELYVLADTTYGRTSRLPVIYVLGRKPVDIEHAVESLVTVSAGQLPSGSITLTYDVAYSWQSNALATALRARLPEITVNAPSIQRSYGLEKGKQRAEPAQSCTACNCANGAHGGEVDAAPVDIASPSSSSSPIFYIGSESLALNNVLLSHSSAPVFGYAPETREARLESGRTNRMLMRRYAVVQKAKDADVFGLVVGTLGVASYLPLLDRLRATLRRHHKKVYTLAIGKLNPAKLANYLEVECFVLVACPENSLIDGAKEFLRPIVTPFELEVALGEREWASEAYELDFGRLLSQRAADAEPVRADGEDDDVPIFSSATGKLRTPKRYGHGSATALPSSTSLITRSDRLDVATAMDSAAGQHLAGRSYVGLEPRYGVDAPAAMETGRTGIAREYGDDHAPAKAA